MELASKYDPKDVESNGINIGLTISFSAVNLTEESLTP